MQDDSGSKSKNIKVGVAVIALVAAGVIAYMQLGAPDAADISAERAYIDIETKEVFNYTIRAGDMEPIEAPSGKRTGYRAEACYWGKDADGRWFIKETPTFVVLKKRVDPTSDEETYCPDCGRRVVGHNKRPRPEDIERANASLNQEETESSEESRGD